MRITPQRIRYPQTWPRWELRTIVVVCVVVIPIGLTIWDYLSPVDRPMLEFLIGTFPNQFYEVDAKIFRTEFWLSIGIGLRTLVVFGIPTILGVIISRLTSRIERLERSIQMQLTDYIKARDEYLQTIIYAEFRNLLREANIPDADKQCTELVQRAFVRGKAEWEKAEAKRIARAIQETSLPEPHARSRGN